MTFYLLTRLNCVGYDEFIAKVVKAQNHSTARMLANEQTGNEGRIWEDKDIVKCVKLSHAGKPEIVLADFNAG